MTAFLTFPNRNGCREDTLSSEDPIPLKGIGPIFEPDLHELRVPVDFVRSLENFVPEFQCFKEPLRYLKIFYGGVTSPADGNLLRIVFLFDKNSLFFQIVDGCLTCFLHGHSRILTCEFGHPSRFVDTFLEFEVVFHDPFQIVFVTDGTDHDVSCSVLHLDLRV